MEREPVENGTALPSLERLGIAQASLHLGGLQRSEGALLRPRVLVNGNVLTFGSKDRDGSMTQGGYATFNVVDEDFVIDIPDAVDLAHAGPMMCAGITVYSPLRRWSIGPGKKVGVIGMGGLGHMAVKIATTMGAEVTVVTTSPRKVDDARRFGAKTVLVNEAGSDLSKQQRSLDFILDTVPYQHDLERLIPLLKMDATLCVVGVGKTTEPQQIGPFSLPRSRAPALPRSRNSFASSQIGGILVVTTGVGRVQGWGEAIEEIRPRDVVWIPPGQKHWHGASPTTAMTHIAITEGVDGNLVEWLEKVSDEQYAAIRSQAPL